MVSAPNDLLLHLESFVALSRQVEKGGAALFEQVSFGLQIDLSVLRRRLSALTAWVGVPLLRGRGSSLALTPAGQRLVSLAEPLISSARSLPAELAQVTERLTVACTGTITTQLIPRVLLALERRTPRIHLTVRRVGGSACEQLVRAGQIDVGVVRASAPPKGLHSAQLGNDRLWYVLPSSHPLSRRRSAPTLAQMAAEPLVLYGESSRTRARVMQRLAPFGATLRVEVDGRAAALEYVQAGFGATFISALPGHAPARPGVRALDVTALFEPSSFFAITPASRANDAPVRELVALLVRYAKR